MEHVLVRSGSVGRYTGDSSDMGLDRDKDTRIGGGLRRPIARVDDIVVTRPLFSRVMLFVVGVVLTSSVLMGLTGMWGYALTGHWQFFVFGG